MTLAVINGPTVVEFVEDSNTFEICVKECFGMLDVNGDGVISKDELCDGFYKLMSLECGLHPKQEINNLYDAIFERFDEDKNGSINKQQFRSLMRELMFAMARGIGNSPILMALDTESMMMKAVEHEHSKN
ncbi:EF-hand calcium-binding domain-containing protein 1 [Ricinus communis]|uniref:Calcium ion binding protein, putative n=1 Tax=Ricinus communis TaxID=3988 RepID=B9RES5_RICCO|nr:EF-hand calcium-binding domain-containing protein 1 [Ricinus communis]EEF49696.1 calcium ion binding protein, putative [Ricinus communis]|eukprot:XP_002512244.1 EF-hand calcium-binding domain-containing protein 1 [Ricinus communis]